MDEELPTVEQLERLLHEIYTFPMHYDRAGDAITMLEWGQLRSTPGYHIVGLDEDVAGFTVSTVWIGIDLGFRSTRPIIFETMIFDRGTTHAVDDPRIERDTWRYATEAEAKAGHAAVIAWLRGERSEP